MKVKDSTVIQLSLRECASKANFIVASTRDRALFCFFESLGVELREKTASKTYVA